VDLKRDTHLQYNNMTPSQILEDTTKIGDIKSEKNDKKVIIEIRKIISIKNAKNSLIYFVH